LKSPLSGSTDTELNKETAMKTSLKVMICRTQGQTGPLDSPTGTFYPAYFFPGDRYRLSEGRVHFTFYCKGGRGGSDFTGHILPEQFRDLARIMVQVDPQAAIRAFGAAMQHISVQERPDARSESQSANAA
jgi:hypothetical protein